jgi:hypothetical protein
MSKKFIMKTKRIHTGIIIGCLVMFSYIARSQFPAGPYLGQQLPGPVMEQFAAGLLPEFTSSLTFTPDGLECFSTKWYPQLSSILMTTKEQSGYWPEFDTVPFSAEMDMLPYLTPDGNRLYFNSYRPVPPSPYYIEHLWYSERVDTGWSEPVVMGSPIFDHFIISVSAVSNGNLYLAIADTDDPAIYISKLINGIYQEPEKLSDSINYLNQPMRAFIATDESYILFDAGETPDPFSQRDIYISYRNVDETWTKAVALDATVNTSETEVMSFISRDDKYIFIGRGTDIYWMDASDILTGNDYKPETRNIPQLGQNFPNPVISVTSIRYTLPQPAMVTLCVYNSLYQKVKVLINEMQSAGNHVVPFDATGLSEGIYFYQLQTGKVYSTRKMIVRK